MEFFKKNLFLGISLILISFLMVNVNSVIAEERGYNFEDGQLGDIVFVGATAEVNNASPALGAYSLKIEGCYSCQLMTSDPFKVQKGKEAEIILWVYVVSDYSEWVTLQVGIGSSIMDNYGVYNEVDVPMGIWAYAGAFGEINTTANDAIIYVNFLDVPMSVSVIAVDDIYLKHETSDPETDPEIEEDCNREFSYEIRIPKKSGKGFRERWKVGILDDQGKWEVPSQKHKKPPRGTLSADSCVSGCTVVVTNRKPKKVTYEVEAVGSNKNTKPVANESTENANAEEYTEATVDVAINVKKVKSGGGMFPRFNACGELEEFKSEYEEEIK